MIMLDFYTSSDQRTLKYFGHSGIAYLQNHYNETTSTHSVYGTSMDFPLFKNRLLKNLKGTLKESNVWRPERLSWKYWILLATYGFAEIFPWKNHRDFCQLPELLRHIFIPVI